MHTCNPTTFTKHLLQSCTLAASAVPRQHRSARLLVVVSIVVVVVVVAIPISVHATATRRRRVVSV